MLNLPILPTEIICKIGEYSPLIGSLNTEFYDEFKKEMDKYSQIFYKKQKLLYYKRLNIQYKKEYSDLMKYYYSECEIYIKHSKNNTTPKDYLIRLLFDICKIQEELKDGKRNICLSAIKMNILQEELLQYFEMINVIHICSLKRITDWIDGTHLSFMEYEIFGIHLEQMEDYGIFGI